MLSSTAAFKHQCHPRRSTRLKVASILNRFLIADSYLLPVAENLAGAMWAISGIGRTRHDHSAGGRGLNYPHRLTISLQNFHGLSVISESWT